EDGVSGVEGVRHISSSITDGLSVTTIQFALETNTDRALNDVKDAVTRVRSNLPQNVNEPLIQRVDVIGLPIVTYAAISPAKTPDELAGTMIPLFGGGEVRLDDLGTVTDTIADRRTFARFNGEPVVALGIKRSKGASDVKVAEAVEKRIDALKAAYPDVDLKLIDTSVEFTKGNYHAAISTLFEGAILAVVVVLLFLRDIRATIIAAISLPLSIFPAF